MQNYKVESEELIVVGKHTRPPGATESPRSTAASGETGLLQQERPPALPSEQTKAPTNRSILTTAHSGKHPKLHGGAEMYVGGRQLQTPQNKRNTGHLEEAGLVFGKKQTKTT